MKRRTFIKVAGMGAAAACLPRARVLGANSDLRVAVIGVGRQGRGHLRNFNNLDGVRVVAMCDPDRKNLQAKCSDFESETGLSVDTHVDYREVLDRKDVDVVSVVTPHHWHALVAIHACQAGKDVYVEKPSSHGVWEGRRLVEAAQHYDRVVQMGSQNRSDVGLRKFFPWMKEGHLGKVRMVRGLCYRNRNSIGRRETPLTPPDSVDYNLWLGPAADLPMYRKAFHYDWHWVWNTGNGDIGNQGPHEMDLIRWALDEPDHPTRILSFGGRFGWDDGGETPNMQYTLYDMGGTPVVFEVRDLHLQPDLNTAAHYQGCRVGVIVECEGGKFIGGRGGGWAYGPDGKKMKQFKGDGGGGHYRNFVDAVRNHRAADLHAPIEQGHMSSCLGHLANISYQLGREVDPDELNEAAKSDTMAMEWLERTREQLAAWEVDFKKTPWTLGPSLAFDPSAERFKEGVHAEAANRLLRREDRAPFIVPEKF